MGLRKIVVIVITMLAFTLVPQDVWAKSKRSSQAQRRHQAQSTVDKSAAYADIVVDADTGEIIHEVDSSEFRHPASLTKMMTLYLAFQALESGRLTLNQQIRVSEDAVAQPPSKLGLREGDSIRVEDAILSLVTRSANDVSVVLAEAMGGSEAYFAEMMTRQARALGMVQTRFRNASGLPDPAQITTARDMAILGVALIRHFPQYYPYFSRDSFRYAGARHQNHNRLMDRYDGMDGIKTGYIRASGFNLVASVKRDGTRLVGVVFGGRSAASRDNRMAKLLDKSFDIAFAKNRSRRLASSQGGVDDRADVVPASFSSQARGAAVSSYDDEEGIGSRAGGAAWGVQIGAYSDPAVSRRVLTSLVSSISEWPVDPEPRVEKVTSGGLVMYRARLMSLDKQTAHGLCSFLMQQGKSCLTVEP